MPRLPYRGSFIEVFGGSGVIILNRKTSKLDVYNDRYGGITAFYKALRDHPKALIDRLDLTCHSREEWEDCYETWENILGHDEEGRPINEYDDIERAARWYYCLQYSFLGQMRSFARITSPTSGVAGTLNRKIQGFWNIHHRLQRIQVENLDWFDCMEEYDHPEAVFYLDPPYLNCDTSSYGLKMTEYEHRRMLEKIAGMRGFVALSGYPNKLYEDFGKFHLPGGWTNVISFPRRDRANAQATFNNNRSAVSERKILTEMLWIKEAT